MPPKVRPPWSSLRKSHHAKTRSLHGSWLRRALPICLPAKHARPRSRGRLRLPGPPLLVRNSRCLHPPGKIGPTFAASPRSRFGCRPPNCNQMWIVGCRWPMKKKMWIQIDHRHLPPSAARCPRPVPFDLVDRCFN